jgi:hypothetical protein
MSTNTEFIHQIEQQLNKWDADVDALRAHGKTLATDARAAYFGRLKELRASRDAAHKSFQEIRCASEESATHLRAAMEGAWTTMNAALKKAAADLAK